MIQQTPYINIHTHSSGQDAGNLSIRNVFPCNFPVGQVEESTLFSVGLHPWHLDEKISSVDFEKLQVLVTSRQVVAIGETGLDKVCNIPFDLQEKYFIMQIDLAEKLNKPLIIHCVKAHSDLIRIKKTRKKAIPWIIHGFTGSSELAHQLIAQGFYLSFGEALNRTGSKTIETFRLADINRIFLETDESTVGISEIYEKACNIKKIKDNELKSKIVSNFDRCFNIKNIE